MSTIEELLGRKCSGSGLEIREDGRGDPLRLPRDTLYSRNLALILPTSGGRSVGIVRSRSKATEFSLFLQNCEHAVALLFEKLNRRPIRIEWHRTWQKDNLGLVEWQSSRKNVNAFVSSPASDQ
jgi:hypothetical protein